MSSGLSTINGITPEQLAEIAKQIGVSTKENGFGITSFSFLVVLFLALFCLFALAFWFMMKSLIRQQERSRDALEKEHTEEKKRRDKQEKEDRDRFYEINNKLIETFQNSIANNSEGQDKFYKNIKTIMSEHYENLIDILKSDKKLSMKQFDMQSKEIIKAQIFEIFDKLIEKVENNNLMGNKDRNCGISCGWKSSEIWQIFEEHLKYGSDKIDTLGFSDEVTPNKLYFEVLKHSEDAAKKCLEVFNVTDAGYKDKNLTRSLRNIRRECLIKTMALKLNEL